MMRSGGADVLFELGVSKLLGGRGIGRAVDREQGQVEAAGENGDDAAERPHRLGCEEEEAKVETCKRREEVVVEEERHERRETHGVG